MSIPALPVKKSAYIVGLLALPMALSKAMAMAMAMAPATVSALTVAGVPVLLHQFNFSSDARSSVDPTRQGTLYGGATIAGGVLNLSGPSAYVEFVGGLVPMARGACPSPPAPR